MVRVVVLNEFTDVIGQDLPVMRLSLWSTNEKIMFFSPLDNLRDRDFRLVLLPQKIPNIIIGVDGYI